MSNNNNGNESVIKYSEIDVSRISSTELEENDRSKGQKIAYPRYDHPTLGKDQRIYIQFPHIKLVTYGVPRASEFYQTENARGFIKVPLDASIPEIKNLITILQDLDKHFSSQEFAEKLLGKKWNKFTYQSIFREPIQDDDEDKPKPKGKYEQKVKLPYMKLKLDTDFDTNAIRTKVYRTETINGAKKRTEVPLISSIDEFIKVVPWQSTIRPIAMMTKFWVQPATKKDPCWGITFKIKKMEVEQSQKPENNTNSFMNSDAFLDSESDNEVSTKLKNPIAQVAQEDSDDSDEEEEKPVAQVETKSNTKKAIAIESDDDDDNDSEEEEKPVAKPKPAPKATRGGKGGKVAHT